MNNFMSFPSIDRELPVLFRSRLHWICFVWPLTLMLVGFIGVPFLILDLIKGYFMMMFPIEVFLTYLFFKGFFLFLSKWFVKVELTSEYLLVTRGYWMKSEIDIPLRKVTKHELFIPLFGQLLDYGTLYLRAGGSSQSVCIARPRALRAKLRTLSIAPYPRRTNYRSTISHELKIPGKNTEYKKAPYSRYLTG